MALRSQSIRSINRQGDALHMGVGWSEDDLAKAQVVVESVFGDSHPGSGHLDQLVDAAVLGVHLGGARPARYFATDICDGIAQAHDGMNYSLASREAIADLVELHAEGHQNDGLLCISSCDKAIPAHLIAMGRVNLPAIHVPGGGQGSGPELMSSEALYTISDQVDRGELPQSELDFATRNACPSCGACQFMGTASTGQVMSESLGLALPGSALVPATLNHLRLGARAAGGQVVQLVKRGITTRDILTREAFENAIAVHSAVGGSSNYLLHLPAIARSVGIDIRVKDFERIHARVPVLANVKTSGQYTSEQFWFAGGVVALMQEIREFLHLDALTVTGKTVGENLDDVARSGFLDEVRRWLGNYHLTWRDVIYPLDKPFKPYGSAAVLRGNLAPDGAVTKRSGVAREMQVHTGAARVFDSEEAVIEALLSNDSPVREGEVIVLRYEGPRASGMPELLRVTEIMVSNPRLAHNMILSDGRFSGVTRGPAIGYVTPEAIDGGPIALVSDGDLIRADIPGGTLDIVGWAGQERQPNEVHAELARRRAEWQPRAPRYTTGILGRFCRLARSAMDGATLD
jgi:dihydroxy-acid dehydratase